MNVLALNTGSSTLKYQLMEAASERLLARGLVEGNSETTFAALPALLAGHVSSLDDIRAVGHRIVHGGSHYCEAVEIDDTVERGIEEWGRLAPLHNPPQLEGVRVARRLLPHARQVAVFDTAFHHALPPAAYTYALPYDLCERHALRRYGFHGISHRYVTQRAAEMLGRPLQELKLISMHLGNGCSACAVKGGRSVDTTMGLTPLEGLLMGTRTGDIDPAAVLHVMREEGLSPQQMDDLLNQRSGLLGISGRSKDMRTLLAAESAGDTRARLAVDVFCYRIRRCLGTYTAVMNGLDAVLFTGGIGENAAPVRARTCMGLDALGIVLDEDRNQGVAGDEADIAARESRVRILVVPTNEELMIVRDTVACLTKATAGPRAGTV